MQEIDIDLIKPNPENPRTITKDKFEKLKKSIQEFPEMLRIRPMALDEHYVVLGGNMRLKALKALGFKKVPVVFADNWTEDQKKEFVFKDNISYGSFDWEIIKEEWDLGQLDEWGMDIPEFGSEDESEIMPSDSDIEINLGDVIEIGPHKIVNNKINDEKKWQTLINKMRKLDKTLQIKINGEPHNRA